MSRLARLVLAAAVAGIGLAAPSAQAAEPVPCVQGPCDYECVMYPCYPSDWVEFLTSSVVTVEHQPMVVCVTEPCHQPMPVVVCVTPLAYCTPR